jgi:hypothetical protein
MTYTSVQKLRTAEGLAAFEAEAGTNRNATLILLQQLQNLYCAIWTESVWQISHHAVTRVSSLFEITKDA